MYFMKNSRILLALQCKLSDKRNEAKVKRVKKAIEVAISNAEEKVVIAEDNLDTLIQNLDSDTDVQQFIRDVSTALYTKDEAQSAIEQLNRVNDYLFEEITVPEEQQ